MCFQLPTSSVIAVPRVHENQILLLADVTVEHVSMNYGDHFMRGPTNLLSIIYGPVAILSTPANIFVIVIHIMILVFEV